MLQPYRHDGVSEYYLREQNVATHFFSPTGYLSNASSLQGMNPAHPDQPAPVHGGNALVPRSMRFPRRARITRCGWR